MPSLDQKLQIVSGDNAEIQITVYDADGNTVDIASDDATFTVRNPTTGSVIFSYTSGAGEIDMATSGASGICTVSVAQNDTAALKGWYRYDIQIVQGGGENLKFTPIVSDIEIIKDMTQDT